MRIERRAAEHWAFGKQPRKHIADIMALLDAAEVEFLEENGGGPPPNGPIFGFGRYRDSRGLRVGPAPAEKGSAMTKEKLLAALDKPRSTNQLSTIVNPGGSIDHVQTLLMQMREEGLVKFDIKKGLWARA